MNLQDTNNFQQDMLSKIEKLKADYNAEQRDIVEGRGLPSSSNYKPEYITEEKMKLFEANRKSYLDKADALTAQISLHRETILSKFRAVKYPLLNGTPEERIVGTLQYEAAVNLSRSTDYEFVLTELKTRYELGQTDFLTRLLESINPKKTEIPKNDSQRNLFELAIKIKKELELKNESIQLQVRLELFNMALSKSNRLLLGLQEGALQLHHVEEWKNMDSRKGMELMNFIEKNFTIDQQAKIKKVMYLPEAA